MKKTLSFIVLSMICISTYSEILKLRTTSFAYKEQNDYGTWGDWCDWEESACLVVVDSDKNRISIYTQPRQEYDIYDSQEEISDGEGGKIKKFHCINEDGLRCGIRIRIQEDGNKQLYVDFANVLYVYSLMDI